MGQNEYLNGDCSGTAFNSSARAVNTCRVEDQGSTMYSCEAPSPTPGPTGASDGTPGPTTPWPTGANDGDETTMDGDETTMEGTDDTSDSVDPTGPDGSSAFAVSKVIAVILSVVGTACFV